MGSFDEIKIENDFILLRFRNDATEKQSYQRTVPSGLIQFHFGLKGKGNFIFNQGAYQLDLMEEKSLLLYNPQKELPLHLELRPNSWIISLLISIKKLH
ncbi:MAG: AraC family transcriptional regulator, partial [Flavobacterium sp.]